MQPVNLVADFNAKSNNSCEVRLISWELFSELLEALLLNLKECQIDVIVAISRGGLIPGVMMSHALNIREFKVLDIKHSYDDSIRPRWREELISKFKCLDIEGRRILIIDDIVGTGKTLKNAIEICIENSPLIVQTACIFIDSNVTDRQIEPDFYVERSTQWIVFPWELEQMATHKHTDMGVSILDGVNG
jgi:hypoxanthine phosphoribosyltransferase